jgi:hypothetical protein
MFSKVNPLDAIGAAKGFYTFKDVVEASQRWRCTPSAWSLDVALIHYTYFFYIVLRVVTEATVSWPTQEPQKIKKDVMPHKNQFRSWCVG